MRRSPTTGPFERAAPTARQEPLQPSAATDRPLLGKDIIMAAGPPRRGTIPEGIWALNEARSQPLLPGRQTLWILKDDGQAFAWVIVVVNDEGISILSHNGTYDGPPANVVGGAMTVQTVSTGPNSLKNYGTIEGVGEYFENCVVGPDGKSLRCEGMLYADGEAKPFVDDFDWFSESPPSARP
jgi:hypothetical protein